MRSRFVRPETRRLELTDGDWITVRARLTAGEQQALEARQYQYDGDGKLRVDLTQVRFAIVAAYLVDWSFPEFSIRGVPLETVDTAVRNLDPDDFAEVRAAVEAHVDQMRTERDEEKKRRTGATASAPTLPSRDAVAGAMSG